MKNFIFLLVALTLFLNAYAAQNNFEENRLWEQWDSPEGISRFQRSDAKENFWKLTRFYEAQIRPTYCSVASAVMALNALSVKAPESKFLGKYHMFTQEEFFSDTISTVIDQKDVMNRGMALGDLELVLRTFPIEVSKFEAQQLSAEDIRHLMVAALRNSNQIVLALYQRRELMQEGGGHWSPIAAYDSESDSFLILDVAKFKYPPLWIDASAFINAMQTSNIYAQSRGFIILEHRYIKS